MKVEALDGDVLSSEISCSFADVTLEYGDLRWDAQKLENLTCQAECGDVDLILPEELEKYEERQEAQRQADLEGAQQALEVEQEGSDQQEIREENQEPSEVETQPEAVEDAEKKEDITL